MPLDARSTPVLPTARRRIWLWVLGGIFAFAAIVLILKDGASEDATSFAPTPEFLAAEANASSLYATLEKVTIQGYDGPQQDPVLSPDGQLLFFDSHNDAGDPMHIHWAKRIDYKTFSYLGKMPGIPYEGIEGVLDSENNFYFLSPPAFLPQGGTTMGRGKFVDGSVTDIVPLKGITYEHSAEKEIMTFDMALTPDGSTLYFSEFTLKKGAGTGPRAIEGAHLSVAKKNPDGTFTRLPNSADILENVNALGALVYNAAPSADGLALAFNAAPSFGVLPNTFIATRRSTVEPFDAPALIGSADEVAEGEQSEVGSLSPDGTHLYFHRVLSPSASQLYVLTRVH